MRGWKLGSGEWWLRDSGVNDSGLGIRDSELGKCSSGELRREDFFAERTETLLQTKDFFGSFRERTENLAGGSWDSRLGKRVGDEESEIPAGLGVEVGEDFIGQAVGHFLNGSGGQRRR